MTDPAELSDGLASLQGRRAASKQKSRLKRTIPPSQNPTNLPPYKAPDSVADVRSKAPSGVSPSHDDEVPNRRLAQAVEPEPTTKGETAPAAEDQVRLTVYVNDAHDALMNDVAFLGGRRRPKATVSRSAVVRFALERLSGEMTPEQVYSAIAGKPVDPKAIGRKRR